MTAMTDAYFHESRAYQEAWAVFHMLTDCGWTPGDAEKDGIRKHAQCLLHHITAGGVPEHMLTGMCKAVDALAHGVVCNNLGYCLGWLRNHLA